jgi:hypothetical protein
MKALAKRFLMHGLPLFLVLNTAHTQGAGTRFLVSRENLCVTEGAIDRAADSRLSVNVTKMRAYVTSAVSQDAEVRFTYFGATNQESRLGSGQTRRQFGLKLRAQDPCNLVYAMWRIEPESKLVVSVKRNPTQHTSAECRNGGYQNIKPRRFAPVPFLQPGSSHTLRAEMSGEELHVFADDREVWEGNVGPDVVGLEGPVGIRSDNAHLEFDLRVGEYAGTHPDHMMACKSGPEMSE